MLRNSILFAVSAILATSGQAATVNGTFAAALSDVTSSTFGIRSGSVISNASGFVTSATGDMSSIATLTPVNFSTVTALNGASVGFMSSFGNFDGIIEGLTTAPAPNAVVGFSAFGNFVPTGMLNSFMEGPGLLTVSFTQTGALISGGPQPAISGSFSFASEAGGGSPSGVPEPASWAMLLGGFSLMGVAMRRRGLRTVTS